RGWRAASVVMRFRSSAFRSGAGRYRRLRTSHIGDLRTTDFGLDSDPDFEYVMIDSTIVRAHQHSAGVKGGLRRRKPLAVRKAG
ncbi:MAG: hypothetical protein LV473_11175, partial [Nitrospira sp.]|nr:hypothetical protein [Nitrospira sp.]